jgi:hypothetical protein
MYMQQGILEPINVLEAELKLKNSTSLFATLHACCSYSSSENRAITTERGASPVTLGDIEGFSSA